MLRMILADDEPVITKGIQMLVDWRQLGIEITGVFDNGNDTLTHILTENPDVAILDISMPGKTGLEIIKEIAESKCPTKVIFLSGFQDFEYAQIAIRYGAKDYLLKPVKRDSLVDAVRKCVNLSLKTEANDRDTSDGDCYLPKEVYQKLVQSGQTSYVLCAACLLGFKGCSSLERQFALFSATNQIKNYLESGSDGVAFQKNGQIWTVLLGSATDKPEAYLHELQNRLKTHCRLGFVYGGKSESISGLKDYIAACLDTLGYFYYQDILPSLVLQAGQVVFDNPNSHQQIKHLCENIITSLFEQNHETMNQEIQLYLYAACTISGSKSDTAIYYLLSCIREAEERFEAMAVPLGYSLIVETMDKARATTQYSQMESIFVSVMDGYYSRVAEIARSSDKNEIKKAKSYIDEHYGENLTLEVMAKVVHMNPFYFSSLFKKQTGENFKDYLNKIRLKHGMELLVMSDKKIYEIAEIIGFKDYRYFTEIFSRIYGITPMAYRKQMLDKQNKNQ